MQETECPQWVSFSKMKFYALCRDLQVYTRILWFTPWCFIWRGKTCVLAKGFVGEWARDEPAARLVGTFTFVSMGTTIHWPCKSISLVLSARLTLVDGVLGSKFIRTNLDNLEQNWILELDPTLHLGSPTNHELSFEILLIGDGGLGVLEPIDFPFEIMPCRFSLNLPLFDLGPSSKGQGSN